MKITGPNLNGRGPVEGDRGLTSMAGSPEKGVKWGLTIGSPKKNGEGASDVWRL